MATRSVPAWVSNIPVPEAYLAALAAAACLHLGVPWRMHLPTSLRWLIGSWLLAGGLSVVVATLRATGDVRLAHADRLVVTGPYARSRNPMYVGWSLLHLGAGVATDSAWVVVALLPAARSIHRTVTREEDRLRLRFGEDFERYRTTVPRYLPRLGSSATGGGPRSGGTTPA
jgi:protein-S-isoprenylcysteine O-methyltransferase Ste14